MRTTKHPIFSFFFCYAFAKRRFPVFILSLLLFWWGEPRSGNLVITKPRYWKTTARLQTSYQWLTSQWTSLSWDDTSYLVLLFCRPSGDPTPEPFLCTSPVKRSKGVHYRLLDSKKGTTTPTRTGFGFIFFFLRILKKYTPRKASFHSFSPE